MNTMRLISEIKTSEAARLAKGLIDQWKQRYPVSKFENEFSVVVADHEIYLTTYLQGLTIEIESPSGNTQFLQQALINRLHDLLEQPLDIHWQPVQHAS